jgi:ATP-binding cassette subfamily F protein 3
MEGVSTKTLELSSAGARFFWGDYGYYLEKAAEPGADCVGADVADGAAGEPQDRSADSPVAGGDASPSAKDRREEQKRRQAEERRRRRLEEELLAAIAELEAEKRLLEGRLAQPDVYGSAEKARAVQADIERIGAAVEQKTAEWEELVE